MSQNTQMPPLSQSQLLFIRYIMIRRGLNVAWVKPIDDKIAFPKKVKGDSDVAHSIKAFAVSQLSVDVRVSRTDTDGYQAVTLEYVTAAIDFYRAGQSISDYTES